MRLLQFVPMHPDPARLHALDALGGGGEAKWDKEKQRLEAALRRSRLTALW
jgi:hypothetical protein